MAEAPHVDLVEVAGRTVVEWSKIEALWLYVFRDLLFYDIGAAPQKDEETGLYEASEDEEQKRLRADAVFFCLRGFDNQWQAISRIADLSLRHREDLRKELASCADETKKLAKKRHKIVHSYYDRPMKVTGSVVEFLPLDFQEMGQWRRRPNFDVRELAGEIEKLASRLRDVWLSVTFA